MVAASSYGTVLAVVVYVKAHVSPSHPSDRKFSGKCYEVDVRRLIDSLIRSQVLCSTTFSPGLSWYVKIQLQTQNAERSILESALWKLGSQVVQHWTRGNDRMDDCASQINNWMTLKYLT
jgi:hypothetical protein